MLNYKNTSVFFYGIFISLVLFSFFVGVNWYWFLVFLVVRFIIILIGSSLIFLNFHVKAFCNNAFETQQNIAITFDDGPSPNTLLVLDLLKKHEVKATFFCVGKNIEKHPELLTKIIQEGHIVGNHSYSHSPFFDFFRKKRVLHELENTNAIIQKITGKNVRFFRPPYGVTNPSIRKALEVTKHQVIGWNIRSMDGLIKSESLIYKRIINRISPGAIILMHDTTLESVNVLEKVLLFLKENKYKVVSLEQLLNIKAYEN
jgi:peptidoglycan/xylan/chitin deacetylase (PgdA/CDA1 family)